MTIEEIKGHVLKMAEDLQERDSLAGVFEVNPYLKIYVMLDNLTPDPTAGEMGEHRMPRLHALKCWPEMFWAIQCGNKTAEFRKNDRDFHLGDALVLQEWNPDSEEYSGEMVAVKVTHIVEGEFGIPDGYVVMSIERI